MFDDPFNASFLTLIVAVSGAAAAFAFDADAASTVPTTLIAQTHVATVPTVVVVERRASVERGPEATNE